MTVISKLIEKDSKISARSKLIMSEADFGRENEPQRVRHFSDLTKAHVVASRQSANQACGKRTRSSTKTKRNHDKLRHSFVGVASLQKRNRSLHQTWTVASSWIGSKEYPEYSQSIEKRNTFDCPIVDIQFPAKLFPSDNQNRFPYLLLHHSRQLALLKRSQNGKRI